MVSWQRIVKSLALKMYKRIRIENVEADDSFG